ncbi:unnamed protein product, partial [Rotaria sp. Silwood2]
GVHAFLFILSNGPFTAEEKQTVDFIESIFGTGVTQYGIVVFTHLDDLEEDEDYTNLDHFVRKGPSGLQELIRKCGGRKFAINNKLRDRKLEQHIKPLLEMMDNLVRTNNGKYYTNAEYTRIEEKLKAEKERKEREEREKIEAREKALIEKKKPIVDIPLPLLDSSAPLSAVPPPLFDASPPLLAAPPPLSNIKKISKNDNTLVFGIGCGFGLICGVILTYVVIKSSK